MIGTELGKLRSLLVCYRSENVPAGDGRGDWHLRETLAHVDASIAAEPTWPAGGPAGETVLMSVADAFPTRPAAAVRTGTEDHEPTAEVTVTILAQVGNDTYQLGDRTIYGPDRSYAQMAELLRALADEVEPPASGEGASGP